MIQPEEHTDKIALNEDIKRAVVACAREEIRKLIVGLGPRGGENSQCSENALPPLPNNSLLESKSWRRTRLPKHYQTSTTRERPFTTCHAAMVTEKVYKGRKPLGRIKSYRNTQRSKQTKLTSTVGGGKGVSDPLSFASAKWIEKSANLVRKSGSKKSLIKDGRKTKHEIALSLVQCGGQDIHARRPQSSSLIPCNSSEPQDLDVHRPISKSRSAPSMDVERQFHQSCRRLRNTTMSRTTTTALERRAPVRPSSSYLVRAKAESLGHALLDEVRFDSTIEKGPDPMPFWLDTNEWENELAKHIVSVYNNNVVSEVRRSDNLLSNRNEEAREETLEQNDHTQVSSHTKQFFEETPTHDDGTSSNTPNQTMTGSETPPKNDFIKSTLMSSTSMASKKTKVLRQARHLIHKTAPKMVWLTGTGDVTDDWHELEPLSTYDKKAFNSYLHDGKYMRCITMIKSSICSIRLDNTSNMDVPLQQETLWKRLVLTSNIFTTQLIIQRKFSLALDMLEITENLIASDIIQDQDYMKELSAIIKDTHAFYYSKRGKPSAALQFIISATNIQKQRITEWSAAKGTLGDAKSRSDKITSLRIQIARFHLHRAFILQQLSRFDDTMKYIYLGMNHAMVDDNNLIPIVIKDDIDDGPPQVLIIMAVAYHNIAVQQILLGQIGDACISSQNCRRLSRQCMTLSSRYIGQFEDTHMKALYELSSIVRSKQTDEEALVFQKLMSELFD